MKRFFPLFRIGIVMLALHPFSNVLNAQPVIFADNTHKLQFVTSTMGQAKCAADMNGDLLDDVTRVGSDGIYIDYQQPDGSFQHRFFPMAIQVLPIWSICAGDLDNNGYNDLLFGGGGNVSFLLANDNGSGYTETKMPDYIYSQRSTLFDIDKDGDLDAFVCHDDGKSQAFRNNGDGNMVLDQSLINTSSLPGSYSAIWTDYNNDGNTDLYITKCLGNSLPGNPARTNLLYHNNGDGTFSEKGAAAGLDDNAQSWSTVFEDFDNDGDFDAFIVNHDQGNRLMRNNGDETFTNVIASSGINEFDLGAWENASGDFNNDGFVDIISELKNELYLGNGDLTFNGQSLPFTPGAIGDFNDDGFLDLTYRSQLWVNNANGNHWLKVNLRGIVSNKNGIGARVEIYGTWGVQVRELRAGQSFSPMNTLSLHFGLGQAEGIDKLVIRWPSGTVTEMFNLVTDTTFIIPEATCILASTPIDIFGETALCQGDSVVLIAPPAYMQYLWSNGASSAELSVSSAGVYHVIFADSAGCSGVSPFVEITHADATLPIIEILGGDNRACEGTPLVLKSSAGKNSDWSNGIQDTAIIEVAIPGIYTVSTDSVCGAGRLVSDPLEIEFLAAPAPQINAVTLLPGDSILLSANGENCVWYGVAIGGNILANTCDFQTPPLFSDTVFYVESRFFYPGEIQYGGKLDSLGFSPPVTTNKKMHFSAWEPFTLLGTDVFVPAQAPEGERTFRMRSETDILAETTAFLSKGKNLVTLNFQVPIGSYSLECEQDGQLQIVGSLDYPYPIGDVAQIDSSSKGLNFYPYFFNWKIQKADIHCVSPRTPVSVNISANKDVFGKPRIEVFPIPASKTLHIRLNEVPVFEAEALIFDFYGRLLIREDFLQSNSLIVNTAELPSGVYQLMLIAQDRVETKTFNVVH